MTDNSAPPPETKSQAETLIPRFQLTRLLNQDQNGRRVTMLGNIDGEPGILTLERAAFPSDDSVIKHYLAGLRGVKNLGANDIYRWYMANHTPAASPDGAASSPSSSSSPPDLKVNLIYPCTPSHIRKYTSQPLRYVTETADVYQKHVKPWVARTQRTAKRLDWIYNILDGRTEQEDVVYRSPNFGQCKEADKSDSEGFLLLPDLNWDRRTVRGLHLLALVERRDMWSLRGLKKRHVPWLKHLRAEVVRAAAKVGTELARKNAGDSSTGTTGSGMNEQDEARGGAETETEIVEEDMLKCYVHYQPTYYHFHVHVVHVMLEPDGTTQSVGKAFALENLISQLEHMEGDGEAGLEAVDISYFLGEQNELWKECFGKIKKGEQVTLNAE